MRVSRYSDGAGMIHERPEYEPAELEAINQAYEIAEARCAEAGVELNREQREMLGWCFDGALRIGGIPELMRYVTEAKVCGKKKDVCAGYASIAEMEVKR